MKKIVKLGKVMGVVLVVASLVSQNSSAVDAATYSQSVTVGGSSYVFSAGTTKSAKKYNLLDSFYYNRKKDLTHAVSVSKSVTVSASASLSSTISATAGAKINVFGQEASASLSHSIQTSFQVAGSVSNTVTKTTTYQMDKDEDKKGYYVIETFTKGYSAYVQMVEIECRTGAVLSNNKKTIAYLPRVNYVPTAKMEYFKNDPQDTDRYSKVHY